MTAERPTRTSGLTAIRSSWRVPIPRHRGGCAARINTTITNGPAGAGSPPAPTRWATRSPASGWTSTSRAGRWTPWRTSTPPRRSAHERARATPSRPWPATRRPRASAVRLTGSLRGPPSAKSSMSTRSAPTWPTSKTPPPATTRRPTPAAARTPAPPAGPSADPTAAASSVRSASAETAGTSAKGTPGRSRSTSTAGRTRCRPPRTRPPRRRAPCWSAPWVSRRPQPANLSARESTWKLRMRLHSPTATVRSIPFMVYKLN